MGAPFSFLPDGKKQMRRSELRLTAAKIFALCKEKQADFLIISGDIFENNRVSDNDFAAFFDGVKSIPETKVIAVCGNHDPLTLDSPFLNRDLPENLHVFGTQTECIPFKDKGVCFYGKSFKDVYMHENTFAPTVDDSLINIGVLHGDIGGSANYNPISRAFLQNCNMDYLALGHIHSYIKPERAGSTYFAYPGCPEPHGFDEIGEKGVIFAALSKNSFNYEFIPTALRICAVLPADVSAAQNSAQAAVIATDTVKGEYTREFEKNLYKIILCGNTDDGVCIDRNEVEARIAENVFFAKVSNKTSPKINIELLKKEKSLKGEFVRVMLKQISEHPLDEKKITDAMHIGLRAFSSEVKYDED